MNQSERPRQMRFLLVVFLLFAMVVGVLVFQKYQQSRRAGPQVPPAEPAAIRLVTLFFATAEGTGLAREGREIAACGELTDCIAATVDELLNGPLGEFEVVLPPGVVVRDVKAAEGIASVDLSREVVTELPAGSSAEMVAVYAIINTIAVNFPEIKRVRILVEGEPVATLKGHLDLRQPLAPDFNLEQPAGPATDSNNVDHPGGKR